MSDLLTAALTAIVICFWTEIIDAFYTRHKIVHDIAKFAWACGITLIIWGVLHELR